MAFAVKPDHEGALAYCLRHAWRSHVVEEVFVNAKVGSVAQEIVATERSYNQVCVLVFPSAALCLCFFVLLRCLSASVSLSFCASDCFLVVI